MEEYGHGEDALFCTLCNAKVCKFNKHCRSCDKCVDGFDHHCRCLNKCVGRKNYATFISLMVTSLVWVVIEAQSPNSHWCTHCNKPTHTVDFCFKLHGRVNVLAARGRGGGGSARGSPSGRTSLGRGSSQPHHASYPPSAPPYTPPSMPATPSAFNFMGATQPSQGSWQCVHNPQSQWQPPSGTSTASQPVDPALLIGQFQSMGL